MVNGPEFFKTVYVRGSHEDALKAAALRGEAERDESSVPEP